jgi:hypothetical protein
MRPIELTRRFPVLSRNGRQADRVLLRIVSSFAPKAQYDGAERARHQVMATLRQFILGGATMSLIEASDPLFTLTTFTLTTNSSARSFLTAILSDDPKRLAMSRAIVL